MAPRRSSRRSRPPTRYGYSARYEPYPTSRNAERISDLRVQPGRRNVSDAAIVIPRPPSSAGQLKIKSIDMLLATNKHDHHTSEYEIDELILRRGQSFNMEIEFQRDFKQGQDDIIIELRFGKRPRVSYGSRIIIPLVKKQVEGDWGAKVVSAKGNKVSLCVYPGDAEMIIGRHALLVRTLANGSNEYEFEYKDEIYMIFNPWFKKGDVYMEDDKKRQEYVMNEYNLYYYGSKRQIGSSPWYQGQFEAVALECALLLLDNSTLTQPKRGNVVEVARAMSAMVNSQDDDGVLVGNWSGDYEDGTSPTTWNGSVAILEEYMKTGQSVKYGQCWVFGSVFTTLMRALGVPTRTVTNFGSAHDADANLTLDYHYDENGDPLDDLNDDSIWNFHVWNDCWMARPDLPDGYGGWQAVDATPQETSAGIFRMGPASLTAIKRGHVYLDYDTKFTFAEVNAETVDWRVSDNGRNFEVIRTDSDYVGMNISTKAVGRDARHDVTDEYKFKEGSVEERTAVVTALRTIRKKKRLRPTKESDVTFSVSVPDDVMIGKDFEVKVTVKNTSSSTRNLFVNFNGKTVYYTGVVAGLAIREKKTAELKGNASTTMVFKLQAAEYLPELVDYAALKFFVMGGVKQTKQAFSGTYDLTLRKPKLDVSVDDSTVTVGEAFNLLVKFTNPLDTTLTECVFRVEGPGIEGAKNIPYRNIKANEHVHLSGRLTPKRNGNRQFIVGFNSKELTNLTGSKSINISA
ncbi:protein-glutamine gamma-glutamyltransferase K-like [Anneissia japonica]|uniref:protein-glutamine gamma-glutamyltransferase K-like n=1 Tax=Anneissia japonica TaxID=1529436 RepID=UPI001425B8E5|nr:protein-glutamine gamma-glutamyltransferase K-like [Anneissia japonica]